MPSHTYLQRGDPDDERMIRPYKRNEEDTRRIDESVNRTRSRGWGRSESSSKDIAAPAIPTTFVSSPCPCFPLLTLFLPTDFFPAAELPHHPSSYSQTNHAHAHPSLPLLHAQHPTSLPPSMAAAARPLARPPTQTVIDRARAHPRSRSTRCSSRSPPATVPSSVPPSHPPPPH